MTYQRAKDDHGRTCYELRNEETLVAVVYDLRSARVFAAALELLARAEEALSYVKLFGQLSLGANSAKKVAHKLHLTICKANGEECA